MVNTENRDIIIFVLLVIGIIVFVLYYFGGIQGNPVLDRICIFKVGALRCENFTFRPETNSLELSIKNDNARWRVGVKPVDYIITELSFIQPRSAEMRCTLDLNATPSESMSLQPRGVYFRDNQTVTIILRCTPFTAENLKGAQWISDSAAIYEIGENLFTPVSASEDIRVRCRRC